MRIERADGDLVLVEGHGPSAARWRWRGDQIEVVSPSGRTFAAAPDDVPVDVAVGLLALRDADRYLGGGAAEPASTFALRTWLETSHDPLLTGRIEAGSRAPSWMVYRFTFLAASALESAHEIGSESSHVEVVRRS